MKEEIIQEALRIVDNERTLWEKPVVFVTQDVGFDMRKVIDTSRKNFWGVFKNPIDSSTKREKFWIPMTMRDVEVIKTGADIDLKDMMFRARTPEGADTTAVTRFVVNNYLEKMHFGEVLDESLATMLIDGTVVWKTWKENGKMKRRTVDLLNLYLDPQEDSLQSAYRVTERALLLPGQVAAMSWKTQKPKEVVGAENASFNNSDKLNRTTAKYVDVWEMWGKIPKWIVTGKKKDTEEVDGHIIVSGLESGQKAVHLIELNQNKDWEGNAIKPYEEGRLTRMRGRWYGLGIAERELALQEWLNTTVNLRINRQYIAQLGLFKIRNGSGITPQQLSQLHSNGGVPVQNMGDIEQLNVSEPGASAYSDEQLIKEWSQSITQAYPIATGENVPASQTATTSSILNSNSKASMSMVKDAMEFLLKRWMDRHALPIIADSVKVGDFIRVGGDMPGYDELVSSLVTSAANQWLDTLQEGANVNPFEMEMYMNSLEEDIRKRPETFLKVTKKIIADGVESIFYTNNESLDTQSLVQNTISFAQVFPEYRDSLAVTVADLMGIPRPKKAQPQPQMGTPEDLSKTVQDNTQMIYGVGQGNSAAVTQG